MAINFDALPQDNPFALPAPGVYKAKIVEAEMKAPKNDPTKPDYLNLKYTLFDANNKNCGNIYDILSESSNSVVLYKLSRFIRACGIPRTGTLELRDLAKLVAGKEIVIDVSHDAKSDKPRAQVDLFTREGYYLPSEFDDIYKLTQPAGAEEQADFIAQNEFIGDDAERPFDAVDGTATTNPTSEY